MIKHRLTNYQQEMLGRLPGRGEEWLDVSEWSRRAKNTLNILIVEGLATDWWCYGHQHARLTFEGRMAIERLGGGR